MRHQRVLLLLGLIALFPLRASGERRLALLPPMDQPGVARIIEQTAQPWGIPVDVLSPEALVSEGLNPTQYPVAICLGAERYLYQVREPSDGTAALVRYLSQGGFLVVGGFVWPFFRPVRWDGMEYQNLEVTPSAGFHLPYASRDNEVFRGEVVGMSFNLPLGLWVAGPDTVQFEKPEEPVHFEKLGDLLPHVSERLNFPDQDPRFRPCSRMSSKRVRICQPWMVLKGESGKEYGPGILYIEHDTSYLTGGKILYVWGGLLQGEENEAILRDLLVFALAEGLDAKTVDKARDFLNQVDEERRGMAALANRLEAEGAGTLSRDYLQNVMRSLVSELDLLEDLGKVGELNSGAQRIEKMKGEASLLKKRIRRAQ